jgi:hypothetical protein
MKVLGFDSRRGRLSLFVITSTSAVDTVSYPTGTGGKAWTGLTLGLNLVLCSLISTNQPDRVTVNHVKRKGGK